MESHHYADSAENLLADTADIGICPYLRNLVFRHTAEERLTPIADRGNDEAADEKGHLAQLIRYSKSIKSLSLVGLLQVEPADFLVHQRGEELRFIATIWSGNYERSFGDHLDEYRWNQYGESNNEWFLLRYHQQVDDQDIDGDVNANSGTPMIIFIINILSIFVKRNLIIDNESQIYYLYHLTSALVMQ